MQMSLKGLCSSKGLTRRLEDSSITLRMVEKSAKARIQSQTLFASAVLILYSAWGTVLDGVRLWSR